MSFMELYTTQEDFVTFDDREGGHAIPLDLFLNEDPDLIEQDIAANGYGMAPISDVQIVRGKWWARYSANGYMDCTDWVGPCSTEKEAIDDCREVYGSESEGS